MLHIFKSKAFRISAILFAVIAVLILSVGLFLRSQVFLSVFVPKVQAQIREKAGIELSVGEVRLGWFSDIAVSNVKASFKNENIGEFQAEIGNLNVQLSLWSLLHRRVDVSNVVLSNMHVRAVVRQGGPSEPSKPTNPLALVASLLENPPATVSVPRVQGRNLSMDVSLLQGDGSEIHLAMDKINADVSLLLEKGILQSRVRIDVGNKTDLSSLKFQAEGLPGVKRASVSSSLGLQFEFFGELVSNKEGWWVRVPKGDVSVELRNTNVSVVQKEQKLNLDLGSFVFQQKSLKPLNLNIDGIMALKKEPAETWLNALMGRMPEIVKSFQMEQARELFLDVKKLGVTVEKKQTRLALDVSTEVRALADVALNNGLLSFGLRDVALNVNDAAFRPNKNSLLGVQKVSVLPTVRLAIPIQSLFDFTAKKDLPNLVKQFRELLLDAKVRVENPVGIPVRLDKPVVVDAKVAFQPEAQAFDVNAEVALGTDPLVKSHILLRDADKMLDLNGEVNLQVLPHYKTLHPAAAILGKVGGAKLNVNVSAQVNHPARSVLLFAPKMLNALKVHSNVQLMGEQIASPQDKAIEVRYRTFSLNASSQIDIAQNRYLLNGAVSLLGKPLSSFSFTGNDSSKLFKVIGNVDAHVFPELSNVHVAAKDLQKFGAVEFGANFDIGVNHPFASVASFDSAVFRSRSAVLGLDAMVDAKVSLPGAHRVVSDFETSKLLAYVRLGEPYIQTAKIHLKADTNLTSRVRIGSLIVDAGGQKVLANLSGQSDLKGDNIDLRGVAEVALPPEVPLNKKTTLKTSGRARIPWQIRRVGGKDFHVSGKAELLAVGAELGTFALRNMSGAIVFSQDLRLVNGKSVAWSRIFEVSPFLRVDTERIRPYLADTPLVRIPEIEALGRKVGPLRARVSFLQNQLALEDVDLSLFDGAYAGKIFIDVQPKSPRVALLGRLAGVDTGLMNPQKPGKSQKGESKYLGARLAFGVDVAKSLAEGRIDVTEIGSVQLKALIQVLDPDGKDAMLNAARMGLSAGYPTYVGLNMSQGYLDLGIQLGGLAPLRVDARQLPLTSLLTPYTHSVMNNLREVPLQ